ncbi:hypothetical protein ACIRON_18690 [Nocardioides sp. NPDC101246]|uniref:hypothetical protein n=1 Tax=Nocardioides sp. NPDC101246 TaxID=3364336 RepID=UPI003811FAF0
MADERLMVMARQVAPLLPEPPAPHDAFGYLAWEELVLTTARRLRSYVPDDVTTSHTPLPTVRFSAATGRLCAESVTTLAVTLARDVDTAPCETLLLDALAAFRTVAGFPVPAFAPRG